MVLKKPNKTEEHFIGAHLSIGKGLHHALYAACDLRCNALQIFTKNTNAWKEKTLLSNEIDLFMKAKAETGIEKIASHTSYLINLAAIDIKKQQMSCKALKAELIRSRELKIPYVVQHPGFHMGAGEENGIYRISDGINQIFSELFKASNDSTPKLLLETTAGQGTSIGHSFEHIAAIMGNIIEKNQIGVCMDTCHIFAAGYDIRSKDTYKKTIQKFDDVIGLENLHLIHVNDSKRDLGSMIDRHEDIGKGKLGLNAFFFLMNDARLSHIPKIIETPKGDGAQNDFKNLETLKSLIN
ncbi:MAG: deoxyribonuclease IV [Desulfobacterales bacterium]|nr:deoxyribonuclease IV [Desulfobacterales bacterium]MBF0396670.1 deoxyribonuclease IV [Desulfobacterales bacterium]